MRPKTIFILIAIFTLVIIAGKPLGQILVDVGNFLVQTGNNLQNIGH